VRIAQHRNGQTLFDDTLMISRRFAIVRHYARTCILYDRFQLENVAPMDQAASKKSCGTLIILDMYLLLIEACTLKDRYQYQYYISEKLKIA